MILLLNGTSSSGKTTIATQFRDTSEDQWVLMSLDDFYEKLPSTKTDNWAPMAQFSSCFYQTAALWEKEGYRVILDTVLDDPIYVEHLKEFFREMQVLLVAVHCPLEELKRRERARGDRTIGLAEKQFDKVHVHFPYDLELNSAEMTIGHCVDKLRELHASPPDPGAFAHVK